VTVTGVDDAVLVARIRGQAATIAAELAAAIQAGIPEYARPADARYTRTVQLAVDASLNHFLDLLQQRDSGRTQWRELFREIGAGEQREGRSLDALQAATRLGARLGWRWLIDFAQTEGLPLPVLGRLAELLFGYLDQVADASATGYAQAQAAEAGELDRRRRRLLELLLAEPAVPVEALAAAAEAARWPLPARLAAVAVPATLSHPPLLPPDVLVGLERPQPCLLVPEPEHLAQRRALTAGLRGGPAAVGVPVPPADAASSLRWARQALDLAERGVLSGELVWCTDHIATLALFRDERLLAELVTRQLAPLAGLRPGPRRLLTDTLLAWLQLDKNATEVAARLHVHPQTVRYRLRQLDALFGPALRDPAQRLELEVALLAERAVVTG
jgi:PucR C-terminal helix-turn-helix domain